MNRSVFVLLLVAILHSGTLDVLPQAPFCKQSSLDEGSYAEPCSPTTPDGSCSFQYVDPQDKLCHHLEDSLDGTPLQNGLVNVSIQPYMYMGIRPNLNLTVTNIKFTELILKTSIGGTNFSKCIKFMVSNETNEANESLFWDCRWFKKQFIGHPMALEYRATDGVYTEYRKFHFRIPTKIDVKINDSQNLELLIYRENSCQCFHFYWARPPDKFNVLKYRVMLNEYEDNLEHVSITETNDTKITFCGIPKVRTLYNISIQPWIKIGESQGWGCLSYSDTFYTNPPPIANSIAALICFLILMAILFVFCCICLIKRMMYERVTKFKKSVIVYEPTSERHVNIVRRLAEFLRSVHGPVLFAEDEIRNMRARDWWSNELCDADLIIILSNPAPRSEDDMLQASTFANVFSQGVVKKLVSNLIENEALPKRYVQILLDHCEKTDLYEPTMQYYHIYKDRFKLLQKIFGPHSMFLPACFTWFLYPSVFRSDEWENLKFAIANFKGRRDTCHTLVVPVENDAQSTCSLSSLPSVTEQNADGHDRLKEMEDSSSDMESDQTSSCGHGENDITVMKDNGMSEVNRLLGLS